MQPRWRGGGLAVVSLEPGGIVAAFAALASRGYGPIVPVRIVGLQTKVQVA